MLQKNNIFWFFQNSLDFINSDVSNFADLNHNLGFLID